jgi:hypothetical protein
LAENAMLPFHGEMAKKLQLKWLIFGLLFIGFLIFAFLSGLIPALRTQNRKQTKWFWPVFILAIYFTGFFIANHYVNKRLSVYYRMGHFALAVLCRAENNRLYLKHGIEMRPGYNGLYVTFEIIKEELVEYVENARSRFITPAIEYRQMLFERQVAQNMVVIAE